METQLFSAFIAVAELESVSRAAERLHLSQPAISKRIALLETRVGQPLFDRIGRSLRLTEAGHTLRPYAQRVLYELEDAGRALTHLSGDVSGRLTIGTSHHIGLHRLPNVLRQFTQRYPLVDLDIQFMDSEVACQAVLAGRLELGVVTLPAQPITQLSMTTIWIDPLALVVSPTHPLAQRRQISLADLAPYPAVLPDEQTYTHRIVRAALQQHGITPKVRLATNYLETLKMLVAIGLGWSMLPETMVDASIKRLRIKPQTALALSRSLGIVHHQRRTLSSPAQALIELLDSDRDKPLSTTRLVTP